MTRTCTYVVDDMKALEELLKSIDGAYSGIHMEKRRDGKMEIEVAYDE